MISDKLVLLPTKEKCTSSELFGQIKGLSRRDSVAYKQLHIIHIHSIKMLGAPRICSNRLRLRNLARSLER